MKIKSILERLDRLILRVNDDDLEAARLYFNQAIDSRLALISNFEVHDDVAFVYHKRTLSGRIIKINHEKYFAHIRLFNSPQSFVVPLKDLRHLIPKK